MLVYFKYTWALQDPIIDICMIPHEGRLEIIVVPVSVHPLQRLYSEKNSRQCVKKIVVYVQLCQTSEKKMIYYIFLSTFLILWKTYWQNAMVKGMDLF